jgi:hypothetical protein
MQLGLASQRRVAPALFHLERLEDRRLLSAQPMLVGDIAPGVEGSYSRHFGVFGGRLYFSVDHDDDSHDALFAHDGVSTVMADPSREYAILMSPAGLGGKLYFTAANVDDVGWEVWRHDGEASTMLLGQENGYYLFPPGIHEFGGRLLFWAHRQVVGDDPVPGEEYGSGLWANGFHVGRHSNDLLLCFLG